MIRSEHPAAQALSETILPHIKQVTFSIVRTIPLMPITGDPADEYANVKPFASCTVEFDHDEVDLKKSDAATVKQIVKEAYDEAASRCYEQMLDFKRELVQQYRDIADRRESRKRDRNAKA